MRKIAKKYNSEHQANVLKLTTRADKRGNVFHMVEYVDINHGELYATFEKLESALDFIHSNFRAKL